MRTSWTAAACLTTLAAWSLACGSSGGGDACTGGAACTPANPCHTGTVSCSTGVPVCADAGGNLADGEQCGTGQVCSGGQCVACTANVPCTPANPCHSGVTSCATGTQSCVDTGTALANGQTCGVDQVCSGGQCVACAASAACTPANPCHSGVTSCTTGVQACVDAGAALANGTACGVDRVCSSGQCVACTANVACTPANPCHSGVTSCATGTQSCVDTGTALANGQTCGVDQVCNGGQCVACTANASCTPTNPCHTGLTSCATGPACVDMGTALADGAGCGVDQVCSGGQCVACTASAACTPANPCHAGLTSCATGTQTCLDTGTAVADGISCGSQLVCRSGTCIPGPSAGCGNAPANVGDLSLTMEVAGVTRSYEVLVPTLYDPDRPLALVLVFHGGLGTSNDAKNWGLQSAPGAATDGIFVFPQGIDFPPYGVGWNESCSGYDMPFFDAMAQSIESTYCVDTNRVFATGFSWGADFTNNLGCCRGDALRAVAPASGADGNYNSVCVPKMPAFRITYGVPDAYSQTEFDIVVNLYRNAHQCAAVSDAIPPTPCVAYRGCDQPVVECGYAGLGHDLPPNWSADVWSWLSTFR